MPIYLLGDLDGAIREKLGKPVFSIRSLAKISYVLRIATRAPNQN